MNATITHLNVSYHFNRNWSNSKKAGYNNESIAKASRKLVFARIYPMSTVSQDTSRAPDAAFPYWSYFVQLRNTLIGAHDIPEFALKEQVAPWCWTHSRLKQCTHNGRERSHYNAHKNECARQDFVNC